MSDLTLAVVGCGSAKRDAPTAVRDLYTSNYFALKREYAEHFADRLIVLSAEHDLIWGAREVAAYDTTLSDVDRQAFVERVSWSLRSPFTDHTHADEVLLLAGREYAQVYREAVAHENEIAFEPLDMDVIDVFAEADCGGIGAQMAWLREAIDSDLRQPETDSDTQTGLGRYVDRTPLAEVTGE